MKRIPLIRRKSLIEAGIPNSRLIHLTQDNKYFKGRTGDTSFFVPFDVLLIFIGSHLFNFFPFRNVSDVVNDLARKYRDLYTLLRENPKRFLKVETKPVEMLEQLGIEGCGYYVVEIELSESLKTLDWENRMEMVLVNLEKIYHQVEDLFLKEGIIISTGDAE